MQLESVVSSGLLGQVRIYHRFSKVDYNRRSKLFEVHKFSGRFAKAFSPSICTPSKGTRLIQCSRVVSKRGHGFKVSNAEHNMEKTKGLL